jgi:hypothetical protein
MRTLLPAPDDALDPATLAPRFGSYRGGVGRFELGRTASGPLGGLARLAREKRWLYVAIAAEPMMVGLAVVRLGYAANAFAFAYHAGERRMLADASSMGPSFAAEVGDSVSGASTGARYLFGGFEASVRRASDTLLVSARARGLDLHARLDAAAAPPSITAVAPITGNRVAATEKRALLAVSGEVTAAGRRFALDGGLAGYDYTQGMMTRQTSWRWAFALGLARDGEPCALNLVEGHVGEAECAAWTRDDVHPLAEGRFEFDSANPLAPWRIATGDGGVDLRFSPGASHAESRSLGVVRSRFVQPVGVFDGSILLGGNGGAGGGRPIELASLLGVTEIQDVRW